MLIDMLCQYFAFLVTDILIATASLFSAFSASWSASVPPLLYMAPTAMILLPFKGNVLSFTIQKARGDPFVVVFLLLGNATDHKFPGHETHQCLNTPGVGECQGCCGGCRFGGSWTNNGTWVLGGGAVVGGEGQRKVVGVHVRRHLLPKIRRRTSMGRRCCISARYPPSPLFIKTCISDIFYFISLFFAKRSDWQISYIAGYWINL